jgi:hypothetical protein
MMKATLKQWEDFRESSFIWEDMVAEINVWLDDIHLQLENPNNPRDLDMSLKGSAEFCRNMLNMPMVTVSLLAKEELDEEDVGEDDEPTL